MGSLLVGVNFAKGFARSLGIPLIDVNHLQGHVMAHFIKEGDEDKNQPPLPFLCLLVSGGNSQIVKVNAYNDMEVLGQTIDDAAGEAIDKCSKVMGLGYPGGPIIDRLARQGNPKAFKFAEPNIPDLDYSFSGLKTSFLYSMQKWVKEDPDFIEHHKEDIAASLEWTIVDILMKKLKKGNCYTCMGCRSFLTPYVDPATNQPKYYGRFNQGVVTLNLPDIALSSGGNTMPQNVDLPQP